MNLTEGQLCLSYASMLWSKGRLAAPVMYDKEIEVDRGIL